MYSASSACLKQERHIWGSKLRLPRIEGWGAYIWRPALALLGHKTHLISYRDDLGTVGKLFGEKAEKLNQELARSVSILCRPYRPELVEIIEKGDVVAIVLELFERGDL